MYICMYVCMCRSSSGMSICHVEECGLSPSSSTFLVIIYIVQNVVMQSVAYYLCIAEGENLLCMYDPCLVVRQNTQIQTFLMASYL